MPPDILHHHRDDDSPPSSSSSNNNNNTTLKKIEKNSKVLHALFLTTETTLMRCNNNNDDDKKTKKKKEDEYRVLKITDNGFCGPLTMTKEKTCFQLEKHHLKKGVRPPLLVTKYASVWEQKKNNNMNNEFSSEEGEHYRDVLSLARMSEQFQSRVVALYRVKELSSSIQPLTTTTTTTTIEEEQQQQQQQQQQEREEDVDFLLATHIFAPGSMKAKHIVEVLDGTIAHNGGNEKSVIKKKREVYALTTALRSLNGLARYVQMPPMKEEDKKETHERLRAEAKRKRCLVLQSKKTIIEAYKEMMLTTPKSSKMADEKKTSQQKSTVVEKAERQTSATTKETKEQQQKNRSEERKEEKPQHENKVVVPRQKTVVVIPVVATNLPPKGRKQKRTPFSPPRIFGQEITNNN